MDYDLRRVAVVGTSCSGKTTLSRCLAQLLDIPHVELDAIYWKPNWVNRPPEEFRPLAQEALMGEHWVVDGNYAVARDIIWGQATAVIWLNYSFPRVMWRALYRTIKRSVTQQELFSGNRETLRKAFLTRDSILLWVITSYRRNRRGYRASFDQREFPHLQTIELKKPSDADQLLQSLESAVRKQKGEG